jgi:epsilon-lactone hydrolase
MATPARPSLRLRLLNFGLRLFEKPYLVRETDVTRARRRLRLASRFFLGAPVPWRETTLAGLPCIEAGAGPTLLWFHGGAYVQGSRHTHRKMAQALALHGGCRVLVPDYRLAPEHPFPAAAEDALACWQALGEPAAIGGDSSGGGLAFALLHMIGTGPRPACVVAFSPWADMTLQGPTLTTNADADPMLPAARMAEIRDIVLAGADPRDPRASPVFAAFPDPPPALILAGTTEIVLGDAETLARNTGAILTLRPDHPHVWPIFHRWLPEADAALAETGAFLRAHLTAR